MKKLLLLTKKDIKKLEYSKSCIEYRIQNKKFYQLTEKEEKQKKEVFNTILKLLNKYDSIIINDIFNTLVKEQIKLIVYQTIK